MSTLVQGLNEQYGIGVYLTPSQFNWLAGSSFTPQKPERLHTNNFLKIDAQRSNSKVHVGDSSLSMGQFNIAQPEVLKRYSGAESKDVIIKRPGEDTHFLPKQLTDLLPLWEKFAAHQYSHSPYATGKIGVMRIRATPLNAGSTQFGHKWHRHTVDVANAYTPQYLRYQEISDEDAKIMQTASKNLKVTEGFWSTACPTHIQTAPAQKAVPTIQLKTVHTFNEELENPPFEHKQANPHELVIGTSETFHRSSVPKTEEHGMKRLFAYMAYFHTHETEAEYLNDTKNKNMKNIEPLQYT